VGLSNEVNMSQRARLIVALSVAVVTAVSIPPSLAFAQGRGRAPANPGDVTAVVQAYRVLEQADHDYQGHRVKAMEHLQKAGLILGVTLKGNGKGQEPQGNSDSQLKQAQSMLQRMSTSKVNGKRHQRAMTHVNNALSELQTALSIK
jgi:hypothetical protein